MFLDCVDEKGYRVRWLGQDDSLQIFLQHIFNGILLGILADFVYDFFIFLIHDSDIPTEGGEVTDDRRRRGRRKEGGGRKEGGRRVSNAHTTTTNNQQPTTTKQQSTTRNNNKSGEKDETPARYIPVLLGHHDSHWLLLFCCQKLRRSLSGKEGHEFCGWR
jgi:hypothetical protein